ncbi:MAG TPA: hypothetical protein VNI83_10030 [Vicinamibacterales bacterium]|nr:hypothetical protein [Vicinamibacterales bacterium]
MLFAPAVAVALLVGLTVADQNVDRSLEASVRGLLEQYSAALESRDAAAVKKVQPSVDVDGLGRAFREMRALDVEIADVKILTAEANLARVSCRVTQTLTPKAGAKRTTTVVRVLRLRRLEGGGWVIETFER